MKLCASLFFLLSLAGSASAGIIGITNAAPGPEMSAGILGMTVAAGVIYLIKRRSRG